MRGSVVSALNAQRSTLNAQRSTLNAQRSTLNLQPSMRRSKILLALIVTIVLRCTAANSVNAATISIMPSKDNTLYEYDPAEGDHSSGAGFHFFTGENGMGELRRGVLAFDIAGRIPAGSTITAVSLSMNMSMTPTGARTVELHKLLADWGEGTSHAPSGEGDGAPATPNDATWRHRFFDTIFLDNTRRRFFGHRKCKSIGWRYRTVHVEL